jgi:hypothetical protein
MGFLFQNSSFLNVHSDVLPVKILFNFSDFFFIFIEVN